MSYKSKLTLLLKMEEDKKNKIQEQLNHLNQLKNGVQNKIQKEEAKMYEFLSELMKGGTISSSFFSGSYDRTYMIRKQNELEDIKKSIALKNNEYQQIKKKIERIMEIDKEREKEYVKEIEKKEQREIEEVKSMMKYLNKGGE